MCSLDLSSGDDLVERRSTFLRALTRVLSESEYIIRHVTIAHGRHRDNGPPERVRNRLEERILGAGLREVYRRRE